MLGKGLVDRWKITLKTEHLLNITGKGGTQDHLWRYSQVELSKRLPLNYYYPILYKPSTQQNMVTLCVCEKSLGLHVFLVKRPGSRNVLSPNGNMYIIPINNQRLIKLKLYNGDMFDMFFQLISYYSYRRMLSGSKMVLSILFVLG